MDTSIIRTPLYYGQFVWSQKCQKSYIPYLYYTDTSVKGTLDSVPLVSVLRGLTVQALNFQVTLTSDDWHLNLLPCKF